MDQPIDLLPGFLEMLQIDHPEKGTWTVKVVAGAFPDTVRHAAYQLKLLQDTSGEGPQLRLLLAAGTPQRGDTIDIRASLLENGKPVPGARVRATVGTDEKAEELPLLDDGLPPDARAGDGIYSGRVRLSAAGFVQAGVSATRRDVNGLPDFDREADETFVVSQSGSRLTGEIRDFARDADGDGLNEEIVFAVGVNVTQATNLRLLGTVRDSQGRDAWSFGKDVRVEAGPRELELVCDTEQLAKQNTPGPLVLDSLTLYESETYAQLDTETPHYRTRAYKQIELMHDAIRLEGSGRATGVDEDHDGKYDRLEVELPIDIRYPGDYYCTGLLENDRKELVQGDVRVPFVAGRNTMRMRFPGSCVASGNPTAAYALSGIYVGFQATIGDRRPQPRYGYTAWTVKLTGGPPPAGFEPTPPPPASAEESYNCR